MITYRKVGGLKLGSGSFEKELMKNLKLFGMTKSLDPTLSKTKCTIRWKRKFKHWTSRGINKKIVQSHKMYLFDNVKKNMLDLNKKKETIEKWSKKWRGVMAQMARQIA